MNEVLTYEALKAERDAQQKRADALAVENAALKTAHPQPFGREMMKALDAYEKHQDEVPETGMLDAFFILRDSIRVETPATDAALAAIEVRGVDKALAIVEACRGSICAGGLSENRQYEESIVHPHLDGISDELESLAAELREAK
ncbi:Uncharacterised protein [Serratia ficaria]|uniref:hypothetical protein n=1 Tax=Serratia ficaria TaxID=61651 RepID=UPI002183BECC|nr:hypothetical protein [Serratia ficaria]CAI2496123.1 Uncharacterised protein [Serratia ficaria]